MKRIFLKALIFTMALCFLSFQSVLAFEYGCGETVGVQQETELNSHQCSCPDTNFKFSFYDKVADENVYCCGWPDELSTACFSRNPSPTTTLAPDTPTPTDKHAVEIEDVTSETLDKFNPLKQFSDNPNRSSQFSTPGGIISVVLDFAFPIAGIILFIILTIAGFRMLVGAPNSKAIDESKQMIVSALVGFIILFAAYWIAQLLQLIFGISILGN